MNEADSGAWHAGERLLQERAGVGARMAELGPRLLRDFMPEQHREFFAELPFLVAGTLDAEGQPWASLVAGPVGFVQSPAPQLLRVRADASWDPAAGGHLHVGAAVGLLGLQAHTGRRNRANGRIAAIGAQGVDIAVAQSFGNCPKYIRPREAFHAATTAPAHRSVSESLSAEALGIVRAADTFFIATAHPRAGEAHARAEGVDVSHRGGPPGFVQVAADGALRVRDYVGNSFFNTLGNLQLEPRCGLLFVDHATGDQLQVAGRAELSWEEGQPAAAPATGRLLRIEVRQAVLVRGGLPLRWHTPAGA
jgi:predicted pyridoxine 5'-phosphate oxidase superfamily flavin-nucleotide-binding protein